MSVSLVNKTYPLIRDTQRHASAFPIAALGDSLTDSLIGCLTDEFYHERTAFWLRKRGVHAMVRANGVAGTTTQEILVRQQFGCLTRWETPKLLLLYAGVNDSNADFVTTVNGSIASGGNTVKIATSGAAGGQDAYLGRKITVAGESGSPVHTIVGYSGISGYGGLATFTLTIADTWASTVAGNPACTIKHLVAADTTNNIELMVQQAFSDGIAKVAVMGIHYMNISGGDTVGAQGSYGAWRTAQQAAVTAIGDTSRCIYVDNYALMSALIGTTVTYNQPRSYVDPNTNTASVASGKPIAVAQGDSSWHYATGDIHLNPLGMDILAKNNITTFDQYGWVTDFLQLQLS